jgi:hypothetical protein
MWLRREARPVCRECGDGRKGPHARPFFYSKHSQWARRGWCTKRLICSGYGKDLPKFTDERRNWKPRQKDCAARVTKIGVNSAEGGFAQER